MTPGSKWRIEGFRDEISRTFSRKLISLGLTPGAQIEIVRLAPLGDPAEVRVRHTSYALRKAELALLRLAAVAEGEKA